MDGSRFVLNWCGGGRGFFLGLCVLELAGRLSGELGMDHIHSLRHEG